MPPTTRAAARARTAAAVAAVPHDLLARVCSFLPPGDAVLTVPRLNKAWAAAAASCVADVRDEAAAAEAETCLDIYRYLGQRCLSVPLWALQEAWPQLSGLQRQRAAARAAFHGDLAVLGWALPQLGGANTLYCEAAAAGGQLEALQYARALGCPWDEETCTAAAEGGHLAVLQWARAQQPPCPWGKEACSAAAGSGHLAVLQWARAQQPPCPWDEETCSEAAWGGHLGLLQWARTQQPPCPWSQETCSKAAWGGHLAVLQWARGQEPPCPWNEETCSEAAKGGRLAVLQWARGQDPPCPWDKWTCSEAAWGGHLGVLQWARGQEPPCPWNAAECWRWASDAATDGWLSAQAALEGVAL